MNQTRRVHRIAGCMLGTALGDAVGLPLENLSKRRINAWLGDQPLRHRFVFGRGLVSDDTEHTVLVAQAIIRSGGDPQAFGRDLAIRLRWWLAGMPAGTGRATARACIKLWLGWHFETSGVWSAGNGPAMRSAIIGAAIDDRDTAVEMTKVSARITHSDPKATYGALAIAAVSYWAVQRDEGSNQTLSGETVMAACRDWIREADDAATELLDLIQLAAHSAGRGESTQQFTAENGMADGVSGYTYQTVPAALHACMRYPDDFRQAITSLVRCGGDVDSTAAIAGGILGAQLGLDGLPDDWMSALIEWPRTKTWMRSLATQLSDRSPRESQRPVKINPVAQLLRNVCFLFIVLIHALRRLLPPW